MERNPREIFSIIDLNKRPQETKETERLLYIKYNEIEKSYEALQSKELRKLGIESIYLSPNFEQLKEHIENGSFEVFSEEDFDKHVSTASLIRRGPHGHQLRTLVTEYSVADAPIDQEQVGFWGVVKNSRSLKKYKNEIESLERIKYITQTKDSQHRFLKCVDLVFFGKIGSDKNVMNYKAGDLILCTELDFNAESLSRLLMDIKRRESHMDLSELLKYLGIWIARMHCAKIYHGDLRTQNILYTAPEPNLSLHELPLSRFKIVDCENTKVAPGGLDYKLRYRDLRQLFNDLQNRVEINMEQFRAIFLSWYLGTSYTASGLETYSQKKLLKQLAQKGFLNQSH